MPVAWTIALIEATPIPLGRKILAIAGLILINAFVLFSVWLYIWNESSKANVGLVTLTTFWKQIADALQYTLVTQMGVSFSIPILIWIAVTFNQWDFSAYRKQTAARP